MDERPRALRRSARGHVGRRDGDAPRLIGVGDFGPRGPVVAGDRDAREDRPLRRDRRVAEDAAVGSRGAGGIEDRRIEDPERRAGVADHGERGGDRRVDDLGIGSLAPRFAPDGVFGERCVGLRVDGPVRRIGRRVNRAPPLWSRRSRAASASFHCRDYGAERRDEGRGEDRDFRAVHGVDATPASYLDRGIPIAFAPPSPVRRTGACAMHFPFLEGTT